MSIYLYSEKINNALNRKMIKINIPDVVAEKDDKKLLFSEYTEKKLQNCAYKGYIINPVFWNVFYCDENNLKEEFLEDFHFSTPDTNFVDLTKFSLGQLVMVNSFLNILSITYNLDDYYKYCDYLDNINIDRKAFARFIIDNKLQFILTENYLKLIRRVFTNENILEYLLEKRPPFGPEQTAKILSYFAYGSINIVSQYIFDNKNLDEKEKLCYIIEILESFDGPIEGNKKIFLSMSNFKPYLIFYLYSMNIEYELIPQYYALLEKYIDKGGGVEITITDNEQLNNIMCNKYKIIKEYFNLN